MTTLKSGHTVETISPEENARFHRLFPHMETNAVKLNPGGWMFKGNFIHYADKIYDFEMRPTDVMIMSFPKCGTIWTTELVWTMLANKNFDNKLRDMSLMFRPPAIMMDHLWSNDITSIGDVMKTHIPDAKVSNTMLLDNADRVPDPRVLRAHLPLSLLPKNTLDTCKIICIARNPKDVAPSFIHFINLIKSFTFAGCMDDFVDLLVEDKIFFGPYWALYKEAWNKRHHPNLHWIFYEDLKADTLAEMRRLDEFLGTKLDDDKLKKIMEYTSFKNMKKREPLLGEFDKNKTESSIINATKKQQGNFFRAGKVGGWKNELTVAQNEKIDAWIAKNSIDTDLRMKY